MELTQKQIKTSMNWSIAAGALSMFWFITATPQQILSVFISNYLGADSFQLGLIISGMNAAALMNLLSIFVFSRLEKRKTFWVITTLVQRLMALGLAGAAIGSSMGMNKEVALVMVGLSSVLSAMSGNISGPGWWAWMSDLIPAEIRGRFFGRRSAVTQVVNVAVFMGATFALDFFVDHVFTVFTVIYLAAALFGSLDVLFHLPLPEKRANPTPINLKGFFEPVRDKRFRRFCFSVGAFLMAMNIGSPFLAPYTVAADGVGAPVIWLGITFLISQLVWVLVVPFWGLVMDKMGQKPVVIIGGLFILTWLGYPFMNQGNYIILLPLVSVAAGFLGPAFWEGISQLMLSLSPQGKQERYAAWYWTFFGVMAAIGPVIGGAVGNYVQNSPVTIGGQDIPSIAIVIILSILGVIFSLTHVGRLKMEKDTSLPLVLSTVFNPGVFRAVSNIGTLSRPAPAQKIEDTLRRVEGQVASLSFDEITLRLDDPDLEVREAAVFALARMKTQEAGDILLRNLADKDSLVRAMSARAMGQLARRDAIPILVEIIENRHRKDIHRPLIQEAVSALGRLGAREAAPMLLELMIQEEDKFIKLAAAESLSDMKYMEAAEHIYYWFDWAEEWRERRQLAIGIGRLIGNNDDIYMLMTGTREKNEKMLSKYVKRLAKRLRTDHFANFDDLIQNQEYQRAFSLVLDLFCEQCPEGDQNTMVSLFRTSLSSEYPVTLHHVILALYMLDLAD